QFFRQLRNTQIPSEWIDIDEIDAGTTVAPAVCRCDEGIGHSPQPIARPKPQRCAGDVKRRRGAIYRNGVRCTHARSDCLLEPRHGRSLREEVRAQNLYHGVYVGLRDVLTAVRDHQTPANWFNAMISFIDSKCRFLPEWNSNPGSTGRPVSPRQFVEKSTDR